MMPIPIVSIGRESSLQSQFEQQSLGILNHVRRLKLFKLGVCGCSGGEFLEPISACRHQLRANRIVGQLVHPRGARVSAVETLRLRSAGEEDAVAGTR